MDKIEAPEIKEILAKGDNYYGISMIKVVSDYESQSEIRLALFPITFEISYVSRQYFRIGIRLYKFLIGLEFDYAST